MILEEGCPNRRCHNSAKSPELTTLERKLISRTPRRKYSPSRCSPVPITVLEIRSCASNAQIKSILKQKIYLFLKLINCIVQPSSLATIAWILLQFSAWTTTDAVTSITLDLVNPTAGQYSSFVDKIRNNVKDPNLKYGGTDIAVIGPPSKEKFLRINFQSSRGTVSLGLKRDNLYVVAYLAMDNTNVNRAYYFRSEITSAELTALFPEATTANQKALEYTEDYQSIEKNAQITQGDQSRKELGLGIDLLSTSMEAVNKKARVVKDEARFLLIAIQMTAEAARFRYIQNLVIKNFPNKFNSENKVIQFEVNWKKISTAIYGDAKNGVFNKDYDFGFGKVRQVKDLQMGLLMYLGKPKSSNEANSTAYATTVL
ncbi:hypothetical protein RND81_04G018400 [Saponaria officinalis]|uniref:rRNA N-glycosylase n=2 Tax=Saponaria officinalis TaxID=3572 RepID=A0AAW1LGU9_SAPOF